MLAETGDGDSAGNTKKLQLWYSEKLKAKACDVHCAGRTVQEEARQHNINIIKR